MSEKIQSYEILEKIGVGGMGIVYKAKHTLTEKIVAIKSLSPQYLHNENIKSRFRTEAKIMAKLEHPNIVKVLDLLEDEKGMYIIMEFIEGKTLDKVIGKEIGPIPYEQALPLFNQILSAIDYAHKLGIIHRDIKPGNIILTNDNQIKVMDFGIAKAKEGTQHTKTGAKLGTLYYMSPEQVKGEKVDERSDIYSLGMTLYEMLAGRLPFKNLHNTSEFQIMTQIVSEDIPDLREYYPSVPEWLAQIVNKMLCKNKDERFNSCHEVIASFQSQKLEIDTSKSPLQSNANISKSDSDDSIKTIVDDNLDDTNKTFIDDTNKTFVDDTKKTFVDDSSKHKKKKVDKILFPVLIGSVFLILIIVLFSKKKEESDNSYQGNSGAGNTYQTYVNYIDEFKEPEMVLVKSGSVENSSNGTYEISQNFYIGKYEVTVKEFKVFVDQTGYITDAERANESFVWDGYELYKKPGVNWRHDVRGNLISSDDMEKYPVVHVSWNDAVAYCNWLSQKTNSKYRLPTSIEWTYAALGGTSSNNYQFAGSNDIESVAWYKSNSNNNYHKIGQKKSNELKIYDMNGNVAEWCGDINLNEVVENTNDYVIPQNKRGYKGGHWLSSAENSEIRTIWFGNTVMSSCLVGFRVAKDY